jgi:hypothetical protein
MSEFDVLEGANEDGLLYVRTKSMTTSMEST